MQREKIQQNRHETFEIDRRQRAAPEMAFVAIIDTAASGASETDVSWYHKGLCTEAGSNIPIDPDIFNPSRGKLPDAAKKVCAKCPVSGQCLEYALDNKLSGIWGGTTEQERRRMRRQRRAS